MSSKSSSSTKRESLPIFTAEGKEILSFLQQGLQEDPKETSYGQFFLDTLQGRAGVGDQLEKEIGLMTQASDAALPKDLAVARSFTRGRPDTFADQTAMNVVADNRIGRDLNIANALRQQANQDQLTRMQAGSTLAGLDSNRFGQGATLLSMLRGEKGSEKTKSSSVNPMQIAAGIGGLFTGGLTTALAAGAAGGAAGGGGGK